MPAFLLSLREGLEAALIIGIVLGALRKLQRPDGARSVWLGVIAAALASAAVALGLTKIGAELEGTAEQLFEGATMLLAAGVLTWMIFWMQREGGHMKARLTADVRAANAAGFSLFLLAFLAVFREGVELALFLVAATYATSPMQTLAGAGLGLLAAAGLGVLVFAGALRLNMARFFQVTSLLLIVFAAGMVAYGAHELIEAGVAPGLVNPFYDINAFLSDGAGLGLLLKALFGYNGNPALTETLVYLGYFALIWAVLRIRRRVAAPAAVRSASES